MNKNKLIDTPHLPKGRVHLALVGQAYLDMLKKPLSRLGVGLIPVPENKHVHALVASHGDMSVFHAGGPRLIVARGVYNEAVILVKKLTMLGFEVYEAKAEQGNVYPRDIGLNGCLAGKRFFHLLKHTDKMVLQSLPEGTRTINVRQGYTKCSVCVVDESSLITADRLIYAKSKEAGLDSLLISPGNIDLPGHDTGFIGGATCKLSPETLAFTGTLHRHPDREKIIAFLTKRQIRPVFLTDRPVFDIGSMIPLTSQ